MQVEPSPTDEPGWSPARIALLRLHHALGLSAALSAELIGQASRNAVISKRRRLGLVGANPLRRLMRIARCSERAAEPPPRRHDERVRLRRPGDGEVRLRLEPLPFMDLPAPADANPKTLAARADKECAWPLGPAEAEGDHRTLFCCAPTAGGRVYCQVHRARALMAPEPSPPDGPYGAARPRRTFRAWP